MLENFQGDSCGSIPPLRMPSLLPHDLCHGRSSSRWLPGSDRIPVELFQILKDYSVKVLHSVCNMPGDGSRHSPQLSPPRVSACLPQSGQTKGRSPGRCSQAGKQEGLGDKDSDGEQWPGSSLTTHIEYPRPTTVALLSCSPLHLCYPSLIRMFVTVCCLR